MSRVLIALACATSLLLSACGSSSSGSSSGASTTSGSSTSSSSARRATACAKATAAKRAYQEAGSAVGLNFSDRAKVQLVITDAGVFRARLRDLEPATTSAQRQELEGLASVLEQHEKLLTAVSEHNLPLARKYAGNGFEERLNSGITSFEQICGRSPGAHTTTG